MSFRFPVPAKRRRRHHRRRKNWFGKKHGYKG